MYIYHLQGPGAADASRQSFLRSLFWKTALHFPQRFPQKLGTATTRQTAKSPLHLIHITGIPQGLPESNDGTLPLALKSRVALVTPALARTRSLAATQKLQEPRYPQAATAAVTATPRGKPPAPAALTASR